MVGLFVWAFLYNYNYVSCDNDGLLFLKSGFAFGATTPVKLFVMADLSGRFLSTAPPVFVPDCDLWFWWTLDGMRTSPTSKTTRKIWWL